MLADVLRLFFALSCFLISLLAVFKAPTNTLWLLSIAVTEYGHLVFWTPLLAVLPTEKRGNWGRATIAFAALASLLFLSPLMRALPLAVNLTSDLENAFGENRLTPEKLAGLGRSAPISAFDLFGFVDTPEISFQTIPFDSADGQILTFDLYSPQNQTQPAPCVLVIHGGAWRGGNSQQLPELNRYLAGQGYVVASISYRLAPRWQFPAQIDDVESAFRKLKSNAAQYDIDSTKFVFIGGSAGGHLAMLAGYTFDDPAIRGVVSFYGPADLHFGYANPANPAVINTHEVLENFLGGSPREVFETYEAASPIKHVGHKTPPTLLLHGGRDELVSFRQSGRLGAVLKDAGTPHLYLAMPWATHGFDFKLSGPGGQLSTFAVEYFLTAVFN